MQKVKYNKQAETGRSMLEMLGVLAIIGVLSIAGVQGYRMAINKHKANQIVYDVGLALAELKTMEVFTNDMPITAPFTTSRPTSLWRDNDGNDFAIVTTIPQAVCERLKDMVNVDGLQIYQDDATNTAFENCGDTNNMRFSFDTLEENVEQCASADESESCCQAAGKTWTGRACTTCPAATPYWTGTECAECLSDSDCTGNTPYCNQDKKECDKCRTNAVCEKFNLAIGNGKIILHSKDRMLYSSAVDYCTQYGLSVITNADFNCSPNGNSGWKDQMNCDSCDGLLEYIYISDRSCVNGYDGVIATHGEGKGSCNFPATQNFVGCKYAD